MVTIIPKTSQEKTSWQSLLPYFAVGLVIAVAASYFVLGYFEKRAWEDIERLEKEIEAVAEGNEEIEKEVLHTKNKIKDFSVLFASHRKSSKFFDFLGRATHPNVEFRGLELNPALFQAKLEGAAPNFAVLGQQIYIFQKRDLIKAINLADLYLGEEGEAVFFLELTLSPELFE